MDSRPGAVPSNRSRAACLASGAAITMRPSSPRPRIQRRLDPKVRVPQRRAALVAGMALVTLVACLAIGERVARLTDAHAIKVRFRQPKESIPWSKPDPVLGWRNNPGVNPAHEGSHEPMTILPDGSRATGTPPEASGPTILIIGDSYA